MQMRIHHWILSQLVHDIMPEVIVQHITTHIRQGRSANASAAAAAAVAASRRHTRQLLLLMQLWQPGCSS
jgi:5'-deoxynucleotidase YfbR-like HD superfamily hydrolase